MARLSEGRMRLHKRAKLPAALWLCACVSLLFSGVLSAQTSSQLPAAAVLGQIAGDDISVIGPSTTVNNGAVQAIAFSNGGVIVVHSGKARVDFAGGGELDVCGPAKFTVLSSGEALTIALSFGRVHLRFDAIRPITIYTPMILAAPISVGEQSRSVTLGLTNAGAMCVLAAHGAVRLQNQLSGESIIVPQPSEILIQGASFGNLPAAAGKCRCDFDEPVAGNASSAPLLNASSASPAAPPNRSSQLSSQRSRALQTVPAAPLPALPQTQTASQKSARSESTQSCSPLARSQRVAPRATGTAAAQPILKIALPPIGYDVEGATPATEPLSVATLVLAKEITIEPQWIFHGVVIAPVKRGKPAKAARAHADATSTQPSANEPKSQKETFWAKLRNFLFGRKARCEAVGC